MTPQNTLPSKASHWTSVIDMLSCVILPTGADGGSSWETLWKYLLTVGVSLIIFSDFPVALLIIGTSSIPFSSNPSVPEILNWRNHVNTKLGWNLWWNYLITNHVQKPQLVSDSSNSDCSSELGRISQCWQDLPPWWFDLPPFQGLQRSPEVVLQWTFAFLTLAAHPSVAPPGSSFLRQRWCPLSSRSLVQRTEEQPTEHLCCKLVLLRSVKMFPSWRKDLLGFLEEILFWVKLSTSKIHWLMLMICRQRLEAIAHLRETSQELRILSSPESMFIIINHLIDRWTCSLYLLWCKSEWGGAQAK